MRVRSERAPDSAVSNAEWGPFPGLVQQLVRGIDGLQWEKPRVLDIPQYFGSLWGVYASELINLVPAPPAPPETGKRLVLLARRIFAPRSETNYALDSIDLQQLGHTLGDCHAWLGQCILRWVLPLFEPLWEEIPIELTTVSGKGLAWTLVAYALTALGPGRVLPRLERLLTGQAYALEAKDSIGDFLTLHIHIENLVDTLYSQFALESATVATERKPGGLRRRDFLAHYRALHSGRASTALRRWLTAIDRLIDSSPLTQMVYADVVGVRDGSDSWYPLANLGQDVRRWHDFWLSHLARSLVGVVLSPPPSFEKWQSAEKELAVLERKLEEQLRQRRAGFASVFDEDLRPRVEQARAVCTALRDGMLAEYCRRFKLLARLSSNVQDRQASLYFQVMALDMVIRHTVTSSEDSIGEEGGPCFRYLVKVLFGEEWDTLATLTLDDEQRNNLSSLFSFLEPPLPGASGPDHLEVDKMAARAGVSRTAVERLIARFRDRESWGVPLPLPPPRDKGKSPDGLLADFVPVLKQRFAIRREVTVGNP